MSVGVITGAFAVLLRLERRDASLELGHRSGHALTAACDDGVEVAFAGGRQGWAPVTTCFGAT